MNSEVISTGGEKPAFVHTTKGLVPFERLEVKEVRDQGDNHLSIAREWYLDGELVRRDAWVTILRGHAAAGVQGKVG